MISIEYLNSDIKEKCHNVLNTHFKDTKLSYRVIDGGYIDPRYGVFDSEKKFINGTDLHTNSNSVIPKLSNETAVSYEHKTVVYIGLFRSCWGHIITDCSARLWTFYDKAFTEQFGTYEKCYIKIGPGELGKNQKSFLNAVGVDITTCSRVTTLTMYDKIIIPDRCFDEDELTGQKYYTKEYVDIRAKVRSLVKPISNENQNKKIFFSCKKVNSNSGLGYYFKYNRAIGEEKLECFFETQGFKIVYPEELSFEEQLQLIGNCDVFAATEGSAGHNSLFLKDGATNIILRRANFFTGYQCCINEVIDAVNTYYIDSNLSIFANNSYPWEGPFYFYISDNLLSFFNIKNVDEKLLFKQNFKDINLYVKAGKKSRNQFNGTFSAEQNRIFSENYFKYQNSYNIVYITESFINKAMRCLKKIAKKILKHK